MPIESRPALHAAMASLRAGRADEALAQLRHVADPGDTFTHQNQCARLARAISAQLTAWPALRVAVLAGSTVDPLLDLLGLWLLLAGFRLQTYNAPFNSWRQEALNPASGLVAFKPDVVWFFLTARDLRLGADAGTAEAATPEALVHAVEQVVRHCRVPVFVNNAEASAVRVLGNFEGQQAGSLAGQARQHNLALPSMRPAGCTVFDLDHHAACFGLARWQDARLWHHSKHPFALDAFGPVAFAGARLLAASRGRSRKCIVLDLDHTLWGGVVGDDGPAGVQIGTSGGAAGEAFVTFQTYLKALSLRGIALAVCSKNEDSLAREPFTLRPEMVLKLDDIAVFQANWSNKADNIRSIAERLNIGLDALVFVDDNPAERALVRAELPEVAVVEMPEDPSDYVAALAAGGWFETLAISDEDRGRARAYRDNAARSQALEATADLGTYLRDLGMQGEWGNAQPDQLARMAQLLNKTNQFQLTGARYAQAELDALAQDPNWWLGWFSLRDKFGDHGLISVVAIRLEGGTAHIEAWAMSCRVFSRGMEDFIYAILHRELARCGCTMLSGRYVASNKNAVVAGLYERLGGRRDAAANNTRWCFDLKAPITAPDHFIAELPRARAQQAASPASTAPTE